MPRVYVVEEPLMRDRATGEVRPKFDIAPAKEYGELVYLLAWSDKTRMTEQQMVWHMRDKMRDFAADDYVLVCGSPIAIAIACTVAIDLNDGQVQILSWDQPRLTYREYLLDVDCERPEPRRPART